MKAILLTLAAALPFATISAEEEAPRCHTVMPDGTFTDPVFLKQDVEKKTAHFIIVATFDKSNYGMNFNGVSKSEGGYNLPTGWTVKVTFCNNSAVPHSVMVVDADDARRKINLGAEPYFEGATTPNPNTTGTTAKTEEFTFVADEEGEFALACGFPTHSANGHRIWLNISDEYEKAEFVTGAEEEEKAAE